MNTIIVNEFKKSMVRSIEKYSKQFNCEQQNIQIGLELSAKNENIHKILVGYNHAATVKIDDILFLSPMYTLFKSRVPVVLNKCLIDLRKEAGSDFITVFIVKSKTVEDIRVMLYVKGRHVRDIALENFIKL